MDGLTNIPASGQNYYTTITTAAERQQASLPAQPENPPEQDKELSKELQNLAESANQRLEFRYAKDLGQVVVKIIDTTTDTVIKEFPPAELQRVHLAIRETLGNFLDKKV